jgi:type II secretory pathway pseudopilin PulG
MVVVIIGILAAIAIPKFAATKDKAKAGSIRSDLRNVMSAMEAYYVDYGVYTSTLDPSVFKPSPSNVLTVSASGGSFTATVSNATITSTINECTVAVGSGTVADGVITCS